MTDTSKTRVVVVGATTVADNFVEQFSGQDSKGRFEVIKVGNEAALQLDRHSKTILTTNDAPIPYDIAVLASGASPRIPDIDGAELAGVYPITTEAELVTVSAAVTPRTKKATVLGGTLLGLKTAKACVAAGLDTTLLEYDETLMPRQLDDRNGLLKHHIESLGIKVRTDARPKCLMGEARVNCVRLIGDSMIPTDLVFICADTRPNDRLAAKAGIPVAERGGVIVDHCLRTADPNIYAIGECANFNGYVCGLISPGYGMAAVLAARLLGRDTRFEAPGFSQKMKQLGVTGQMINPPATPGRSSSRPTEA